MLPESSSVFDSWLPHLTLNSPPTASPTQRESPAKSTPWMINQMPALLSQPYSALTSPSRSSESGFEQFSFSPCDTRLPFLFPMRSWEYLGPAAGAPCLSQVCTTSPSFCSRNPKSAHSTSDNTFRKTDSLALLSEHPLLTLVFLQKN